MSADANPPARLSWKRRLLRYLSLAAITYVGLLLVLLALENSLVYHPSPATDWLSPPSAEVRDIDLTLPDGTKIHSWWYPRAGATGALLYCHGNAGNLSHRGGTMGLMRHHLGESVLIFDYPGYGKSAGSPSEAGCYAAADAAYDWLTKVQQIPAEKIVIYGGSLGGGVAVDLASRREHRALILCKTFTSMPDVGAGLYPWLPVRWLMRNRFESATKIATCKRPVFIAHGTADELIPFSHGQRLYQVANDPKHFFRMEGIGHNSGLPDAFFVELLKFLDRVER
ncbi:MAG TPA: alpha/beta hydrolase [Gemmataceae bacterium]|nr:alpha/beta hydrolase [Gemmataceae bacterium]